MLFLGLSSVISSWGAYGSQPFTQDISHASCPIWFLVGEEQERLLHGRINFCPPMVLALVRAVLVLDPGRTVRFT
jgi:hypothetical protein